MVDILTSVLATSSKIFNLYLDSFRRLFIIIFLIFNYFTYLFIFFNN